MQILWIFVILLTVLLQCSIYSVMPVMLIELIATDMELSNVANIMDNCHFIDSSNQFEIEYGMYFMHSLLFSLSLLHLASCGCFL